MNRYHLDDGVRDVLDKEITTRVSVTRLDSDGDEAILAGIGAHALLRHLPGEILHGIQTFTATGNHALAVANLPTQKFPDTPVSGFGDEAELAVVNAVHFGLIRLLECTPFAVSYENGGRLIRNVVPNPAAAGTTSSWGADSEFFWHSDNPHQPFGEPGSDPRLYAPRYLTFYGVRNEERVPTELTSIEDVVARLDDATYKQLMSPEFDVGAPDSNDTASTEPLRAVPLLDTDPSGHYRVRYDRGTTAGCTASAAEALGRWCEVLRRVPAEDPVLRPGEFLVFDNYRVLHRRRAFTPGPGATARWLRRCYVA